MSSVLVDEITKVGFKLTEDEEPEIQFKVGDAKPSTDIVPDQEY